MFFVLQIINIVCNPLGGRRPLLCRVGKPSWSLTLTLRPAHGQMMTFIIHLSILNCVNLFQITVRSFSSLCRLSYKKVVSSKNFLPTFSQLIFWFNSEKKSKLRTPQTKRNPMIDVIQTPITSPRRLRWFNPLGDIVTGPRRPR